MKRVEYGSAIFARALECAITAVAVLLAGDGLRAILNPFWRIMKLLFGT